jgi:hypothetical protein
VTLPGVRSGGYVDDDGRVDGGVLLAPDHSVRAILRHQDMTWRRLQGLRLSTDHFSRPVASGSRCRPRDGRTKTRVSRSKAPSPAQPTRPTGSNTASRVHLRAPNGPADGLSNCSGPEIARSGLKSSAFGYGTRLATGGSVRTTRSWIVGYNGNLTRDRYGLRISLNSATIRDRRIVRRRVSASSRI